MHFSFNHSEKKRLKCALWLATKWMYSIFHTKIFNKLQLLRDSVKEIDWNLNMERKIGSVAVMMELRDIMSSILRFDGALN